MRRLAWLPFGLAILIAAAALWLESIDGRGANSTDTVLIPIVLLYALVGALVATREPRNAVGWLLSAFSLAMVASALTYRYAIAASDGYGIGGGEVAASLGWLWLVALAVPVFLAHLLPSGRPLSPAWGRLLVVTAVAFLAVLLVFGLGSPGVSTGEGAPLIPNPLFVPAMAAVFEFVNNAYGIYVALFIGGAAALIVRTRRSRGAERQQLKWIVAGVVSMIVLFIASNSVGAPLTDVLFALALLPLPVSIGVAILRYRLYDIDILINRALVYGPTTAVIALAFFGLVLLVQTVLSPFTQGNELAVAVSTLVSLALFQPLRRRLQAAVDRRFYRLRYDAARTLDAFSARLRDEVDLDAVRADLVSAAKQTVQPTQASVWIRGEGQ